MLVLTIVCIVLFAPPLISALLAMRDRLPAARRWSSPFTALSRLGSIRAGDPASGTFRVVDRAGRAQVPMVSQAVYRTVTGTLQSTSFTNETIARSEAWAILAHPEIYGPLEQHRSVIERDASRGFREFAGEHRQSAFAFSLDYVMQDPDLAPGEIRVVTALEAKARAASIKQAEHSSREARRSRQQAAAESQPRLTLLAGDGPDRVALREGDNSIGRHPDMGQGQVLVATVSRTHAVISIDPFGNASVEDQGSAHGTFVDDEELTPYEAVPLAHAAVVRLGKDVAYRYEAGSIGLLPTTK